MFLLLRVGTWLYEVGELLNTAVVAHMDGEM